MHTLFFFLLWSYYNIPYIKISKDVNDQSSGICKTAGYIQTSFISNYAPCRGHLLHLSICHIRPDTRFFFCFLWELNSFLWYLYKIPAFQTVLWVYWYPVVSSNHIPIVNHWLQSRIPCSFHALFLFLVSPISFMYQVDWPIYMAKQLQ